MYSIHQKMLAKKLRFAEVMDIYGFRVIVNNIPACYAALGALHNLYHPKPGRFKDYIAIPKSNGYQSLHTTLVGPYGLPIEVQIRTREMDAWLRAVLPAIGFTNPVKTLRTKPSSI